MMTIDCRKLSCPAPVINVKRALEEYSEIRVLLDDGAPHENVARFARNRGCRVTEEQGENSDWSLTIFAAAERTGASASPASRLVMITSDKLGDGPDELGRLLMKNFIHTLLEYSELPARMIFINSGVLLTCEDSDVLEALDKLAGMGVEIFSCGLCLDYYHLKEKLRSGLVTNMLTTVESLMTADGLIKL